MKPWNIKKSILTLGSTSLICLILNSLKSCNNIGNLQENCKFNKSLNASKWDGETFSLPVKFSAIYEGKMKRTKAIRSLWLNREESPSAGGPALTVTNKTKLKRTTNRSTFSASNIMDYLLWTNQSSCQIAQYFGGIMVSSADGLVSLEGQKALCLDYSVRPIGAISGIPGRCLVYSFGINNEWSFDDAMELYGCKVFSFDPSMNISNHNRTRNIHFYQMALGSNDKDVWDKSLNIPTRTLLSIYNMLKPLHADNAVIDYLKIDIETAEWQVLPEIMASGMMDKVRQLAVEIHVDFNKNLQECYEKASILRSVESYGMVRFDSKPNINSLVNATHLRNSPRVFNGYEMAWYNNRLLRDVA